MQQKPNKETTGQKSIDFNPSRLGDIYELTVAREAMFRGAEVFRNMSCVGKIDFVLVKDDKVIRIDVKHMKLDPITKKWKSNARAKPLKGIYHVYVDPENWKPRWNKRHIPEGWETFWD